MDQIISTFGIDWQLLIAQSINFVLLLVVLSYFLYKPVIGMLNKRQEMLEKQVRDAKEAESALAEIEGTRTATIQGAEKEAQAVIANAKTVGEEARLIALKDASTRADAVLADAKAQAEELKRQALKESEAEVAKLVVLGAEKILRQKHS